MHVSHLAFAMSLVASLQAANAATCGTEDYETHVNGASQCLLMRRYGSVEPAAMVVWLHGDVSSGGPANYHFGVAQNSAAQLSSRNVLSVALVRPGYADGAGESSSVSMMNSGRSDSYTKDNSVEIGTAIDRLRARFKPKTVVLVGHSGGAAMAATILGLKPDLVHASVLVSCPCDLNAWRVGKHPPWSRSENPMKWVDRVAASTKVIALTGSLDNNTSPELARLYVEALKARGVDARFRVMPNQAHNGALAAPEVMEAVRELLSGG